jgi:hypothetical protein
MAWLTSVLRSSYLPRSPPWVGTIRSNLDPFDQVRLFFSFMSWMLCGKPSNSSPGQYPDTDLWYALNKVHLKSAVEAMGGLDAAIAECTFTTLYRAGQWCR